MDAGALAALGQALIPFYTGRIIDYASIDPDTAQFEHTIVLLVLVALGCSIFTGIRGGASLDMTLSQDSSAPAKVTEQPGWQAGFFTVCMARLNVRIRTRLFDSLLGQELGYFDCTKTGAMHGQRNAVPVATDERVEDRAHEPPLC